MFTRHLYQFYPFSCHQHWPMNHIMKCRQETHPVTPCTHTHTQAPKHTHTLSLVSEKTLTPTLRSSVTTTAHSVQTSHIRLKAGRTWSAVSQRMWKTHMSFLLPCRRLWTPSCHHRTDTHMTYINLVVLLLICTGSWSLLLSRDVWLGWTSIFLFVFKLFVSTNCTITCSCYKWRAV